MILAAMALLLVVESGCRRCEDQRNALEREVAAAAPWLAEAETGAVIEMVVEPEAVRGALERWLDARWAAAVEPDGDERAGPLLVDAPTARLHALRFDAAGEETVVAQGRLELRARLVVRVAGRELATTVGLSGVLRAPLSLSARDGAGAALLVDAGGASIHGLDLSFDRPLLALVTDDLEVRILDWVERVVGPDRAPPTGDARLAVATLGPFDLGVPGLRAAPTQLGLTSPEDPSGARSLRVLWATNLRTGDSGRPPVGPPEPSAHAMGGSAPTPALLVRLPTAAVQSLLAYATRSEGGVRLDRSGRPDPEGAQALVIDAVRHEGDSLEIMGTVRRTTVPCRVIQSRWIVTPSSMAGDEPAQVTLTDVEDDGCGLVARRVRRAAPRLERKMEARLAALAAQSWQVAGTEGARLAWWRADPGVGYVEIAFAWEAETQ